ncbi:hypothetical protein Pmani_014547 [Petrolisthes manimaculis]|uniref:Cuticle protein 6 n=1 Tax=Petrolisthes manimaculis TaxID=1843537 RepID=A0AAE1PVT4_9EUCA|nr:hypothetical protein Pmani_014547 [Petrolisthes manimaculis]
MGGGGVVERDEGWEMEYWGEKMNDGRSLVSQWPREYQAYDGSCGLVLFSVGVTCCVAAPVQQQQQQQKWTAYILPQNTYSPGLILPFPTITLPTLPTINNQNKPSIANLPSVSVTVSDTKPVISLIIPSTTLKAGAVPGPVPVVKSAHVAPSPVPAPALVVKSIPAAVPTPVVKTVAVAPVPVVSPVVVAAAPEPLAAPEPPMPSLSVPFVGGQFHAQDEAKQYTFGHWGGPNTRVEMKDSLGRVSGSFAYINPEGDVHVRKYAAAPGMGFKVAASDLPEDTPAVAQVKATLAQAHAEAKASHQQVHAEAKAKSSISQ